MNGVFLAMQGAVAQGVLWGIMVLGVYITYKLLDIADLTVDGSFSLGGCVCAIIMVNRNNQKMIFWVSVILGAVAGIAMFLVLFKLLKRTAFSIVLAGSFGIVAAVLVWIVFSVMLVYPSTYPFMSLIVSALAGVAAGAVTGVLHTMFEIPAILAGILTQIALWSVNLRILGGKSNLSIAKDDNKQEIQTIMNQFENLTGFSRSQAVLVVGLLFAVLMIVFLYWFFGTEIGSALRATGNNEAMIRALGVNTKNTKLLALMMSNGLVGLSGALVCQSQKYGDVGMGTGAIVIGLAAIVIGEVLMGRLKSFSSKLTAAVVGSVVYFLIRAIVLQLGMKANDMKLLSAIIVALALCVPVMFSRWKMHKAYSEDGGGN